MADAPRQPGGGAGSGLVVLVVVLAGCGLSYGAVLAFLSMLAAGGGHGCYVLMGLASSPLGLATTDNCLVAWVGTVPLWCVVGILLGLSGSPRWRAVFLLAMAVHYLCLWPTLHSPDSFYADWSYLPKVKDVVYPGVALYAIGQAVVWGVFFGILARARRTRRAGTGLCRRCGYNLTGNVSGICPECGTPIAATPTP